MLLVKYLFVVLHITTAAAWFGLALPLVRRARTVADGGPTAAPLAEEGARIVKLLIVFSVLTLVFAFVAFSVGISVEGGGAYGWPYHLSLLLVVGIVGVSVGLVRPGWNALRDGDAGGLKRVAAGTGIGHTLWLITLVLMFWTEFAVAFSVM